MPIVETKKYTRPSLDVPFFDLSNDPVLVKAKADMGYVFTDVERTPTYIKKTNADGSMITERTISDSGLIQTIVVTFANLEIYSRYDTTISIAVDYALKSHSATDTTIIGERQYTQSGIDQPFTCTTTYSYNSETHTKYPQFSSFIDLLESSKKLISLTNNGSVITAVHQYDDSADYTENHWLDYTYINGLYAGGVTRTITYALV